MKKMKWLKRALTAIKRNPVKTAILLLLVFVLGSVIATTISIEKAVSVTEQRVYDRSNTIAVIDFDYDLVTFSGEYTPEESIEIQEDPNNWSTPETFEKVGNLPYVEYYDYTYNSLLSSPGEEAYVKAAGKELEYVPNDLDTPNIALKGTRLNEPVDFKTNMLKITDGRLFTEQEIENGDFVLVISKELAERNGLKVGSTIVQQSAVYEFTGEEYDYDNPLESHSWEYEVIGIFEIVNEGLEKTSAAQKSDSEIYNLTYTTNIALEKKSDWYIETQSRYNPEIPRSSYVQYENYFVLKNPSDVEAFKEAAEQYLPPYNKITATSDFYSQLTTPLENMKSMSSIALYVSIGASILILGLTVTLFLRDRRHEIGIYMSLGEKKIKILLQIFSEVAIIAVIGVTVSLFVGNMVSAVISEKIVEEQVTEQQKYVEELIYNGKDENGVSILNRMGYSKLVDGEYIIDNYSVSLTADVVFIFYAVGLATVILSTSLPLIYVMRLKPKKVLMMEN